MPRSHWFKAELRLGGNSKLTRIAGCPAGQACVQLSSLAPDFASAIRQLSNAVLHFESVSSLHTTTPRPASGPERPLDSSKASRCCGTRKPEHAQPISWLSSEVL